jgi:hypothetical protein
MDTILLETFPYSQKQKVAFRELSAFIQQALVSEDFYSYGKLNNYEFDFKIEGSINPMSDGYVYHTYVYLRGKVVAVVQALAPNWVKVAVISPTGIEKVMHNSAHLDFTDLSDTEIHHWFNNLLPLMTKEVRPALEFPFGFSASSEQITITGLNGIQTVSLEFQLGKGI